MINKKCEVEVFSRVTGFFRPVQSWNKGKTSEFKDRRKFNIDMAAREITNDYSRVTKTITG